MSTQTRAENIFFYPVSGTVLYQLKCTEFVLQPTYFHSRPEISNHFSHHGDFYTFRHVHETYSSFCSILVRVHHFTPGLVLILIRLKRFKHSVLVTFNLACCRLTSEIRKLSLKSWISILVKVMFNSSASTVYRTKHFFELMLHPKHGFYHFLVELDSQQYSVITVDLKSFKIMFCSLRLT